MALARPRAPREDADPPRRLRTAVPRRHPRGNPGRHLCAHRPDDRRRLPPDRAQRPRRLVSARRPARPEVRDGRLRRAVDPRRLGCRLGWIVMTDPLALDPVLAPGDRSTDAVPSTPAPTRAHDEA